MMVKGVSGLALVVLMAQMLPVMAADCQMEATNTQMLLLQYKQNALSGKKQNQDQFKAEFQGAINRMKQGNCMNELMGLMSFIQTEQKTYPDPNKKGK